MQQLMEWNHGQYDFDIALDKIVSGAAQDIETDEEYKYTWRSFGYHCLERYPEFIREDVLEAYKNGNTNIIDSLFSLAYTHAHFIEFADFPSNAEFVDSNNNLYHDLQRGVSKDDLPNETTPNESKRYDISKILDLIEEQSLLDLEIDDDVLIKILNRMTSPTESKQIKIDEGEK
ncbi:MAG: hypothetical protein IJ880_15435 [Bacilli bacterium]|nr:hypothetical protein [Bacilli bacterium]